TAPVVVPDIQGPQVSAIPTAASCANNDGQIQVITTGGASPFQIAVDGGAFFNGQTNWGGLDSGTHNIIFKDYNGCLDSATALVPINDTMKVAADTVAPVCQGVGDTLQAVSNIGGVSFTWSPAAGLSNVNSANPVATPSATTSYIVTGTLGGCIHADTVNVP